MGSEVLQLFLTRSHTHTNKANNNNKKKICEGRITLTGCADSCVCDRERRRTVLRFMDFRCCAGSLSQLLCRIRHALSHFKIQIAFDAALILIVTLSPLTFLQAIGSAHICNVAWEWFEGAGDLYLFIFNPSPPKYAPPFSGRGCEIVFLQRQWIHFKWRGAYLHRCRKQLQHIKEPQKWERSHFLIDCSIWL